MNNQFEPSQENCLSAILEVHSAHLEGTVLSQSSVIKAGWLVYCLTIRSHSRIRWSLTETFALRVIKIRDFCMAVQKLHFQWIRFSQLDLPTSVRMWHPIWCMKCWQGLSPMYTESGHSPSLPLTAFSPTLTSALTFPVLVVVGATFQFPSLQPVQIKGSRITGQISVRSTTQQCLPDFFQKH